jgi:hypothetical protein
MNRPGSGNSKRFLSWELTKRCPWSISTVELDGDNLARHIYIDESGISANEPILVVAGVVIGTDKQWKDVAGHLDSLVEQFVREEDRDGFVFHATELFGRTGKVFGKRDKYSIEHCHNALKELLRIPARFYLSVVYGFVYKQPRPNVSPKFSSKWARTVAGIYHEMAFSSCAVAAEVFMQDNADPNEIATLVAENNTDTRRSVKQAHRILKGKNLKSKRELDPFSLLSELAPGRLPLRKIIDTVHLVEKHEAPLLQVADAAALIIRYCLEERADAQDFIKLFSQGHPEKLIFEAAPDDEHKTSGYKVLVFSDPATADSRQA